MRRAPLLAILLVGALCAAGCRARGDSPNLVGSARDVLVVGAAIDALSLDPAEAYEFTSTWTDMEVYDTLIRYDNNDFTRPQPSLAERWTISPDGLTYTFHLRHGLRFASGAKLDAEAVRFSLLRTLALGQAPAELLSDNIAPDRVRVVDPYTIEIRLPHPSSYFLCTLYNPGAAIVDPTVINQHAGDPSWLLDHSAGSGPFVIKSWERDISIVLERNENYWGPLPKLKRVIIKDVKEPGTERMMLERGDIDMAFDLSPREISQVMTDSHFVQLVEGPFLRVFFVGMNAARGPFQDERVRQAVRCAINYDELVKYLAGGHAIELQGPIIKGLLGYAPDLVTQTYDPERARELLREAGYYNGFDTTLCFSTGPTTFGPTRDEMSAKIMSDLTAVGIRVHLDTLSFEAYLEKFRGKMTDMVMGDWGADYPDSYNFTQPFGLSTGTLARRVGFEDKRLDPMIEAAGRELDVNKRRDLYVKIQQRLMDIGPWAILLQPTRVLPIRTEVHGYHYNAQAPLNFASVWKAEP